MLFERSGNGAFFPPESYRENALVSFGTHDVATFAGWWDQHDLAVKQALGMDPGETSEERHGALDALRRALRQRGRETVHLVWGARTLAGTPSQLVGKSVRRLPGRRNPGDSPGT